MADLFRVNDADHLSKKIISYYRDPEKLNKKLILSRNNIKKYTISEHTKKYQNIFIVFLIAHIKTLKL